MLTLTSKPTLYQLPHSTKVHFLHLLRRLLREASYLPDPAAQTYYRSYLVLRFRAYSPRKARLSQDGDFSSPPGASLIYSTERASSLLQSCQKTLNGLRRANTGYYLPLQRVLEMTYGRIGKRRHELLAPYLLPDTPANDASLKEILATSSLHSTTVKRDPRDENVPIISDALRALATSQKRHAPAVIDKPPIRRVDAIIPALNSKARPMPVKRVRNIKRREYQDLIERILPPLPQEEWNRLHGLVNHKTKWDGPVRRRTKATHWDEPEDYVESFIRLGTSSKRWGGKHELSPRLMRRMWGRIFEQCPSMSKEPASGKWTVEWGRMRDADSTVPALSAAEASMFGAIDAGLRGEGSSVQQTAKGNAQVDPNEAG